MAQRRMFSKKITNTDQFLDLPLSSQALYFHLNMNADDDGFLDNVKSIIRLVGASNDDFKLLVAKQFVITFKDGITVIRDWRIHNYIQKDRHQPTLYKNELNQLCLDSSNRYIKDANHVSNLDTKCIQHVSTGKVRLGKVSEDIDKDSKKEKRSLAKAKQQFPWKTVIDYLNKKANKHFRYTETSKRLIIARNKEKFSLDDMKKVIDNKCNDWLNDDKMNQYLRPATLFQSKKFEGYLNEVVQPSEPHVSKQDEHKKQLRARNKFVLYKYSETGNNLDEAMPIIQAKYPEINTPEKALRILFPERYLRAGVVEVGY
ncbi:DNA replication protein [Lentilactobacillus buchneri]|uniref:conserved phage C-terminal domain-containing protein n=1 Tax=Lentilactobacillus buchneri TaxID=1581 RepID=UPI0021A2DD15|nr:conserved phage C-terminal domain-containing protein [Lentilactobacillus buchneri]MCT3542072.1 DNA replication protein [Lentilactobacillus buchneri]